MENSGERCWPSPRQGSTQGIVERSTFFSRGSENRRTWHGLGNKRDTRRGRRLYEQQRRQQTNPAFFGDLANALDRLEARFADLPVVLTSRERIFSAGFDFDYWFRLIARRDVATVQHSYTEFKKINLRLFLIPGLQSPP
jgi:hypothetical protein